MGATDPVPPPIARDFTTAGSSLHRAAGGRIDRRLAADIVDGALQARRSATRAGRGLAVAVVLHPQRDGRRRQLLQLGADRPPRAETNEDGENEDGYGAGESGPQRAG